MRRAFTKMGRLSSGWRGLAFLAGMAAVGLVFMALFVVPPLTAQSVESSTLLNKVVPNPNGVYIGAYPFSPDSDLESAELDFDRNPLKLVKTYRAWFEYGNPDGYLDFDLNYKPNFDLITANGSAVYLNWDAWDSVSTDLKILDQINSGQHDQYVKSVAARIRDDYGAHQVLIDLFHEANGDWYPWSPERGTSAASSGEKYQNFRNAYRRVRELFDGEGVSNVTWVLSFNTDTVNASSDFTAYYPGESYVDWLGLDGYNWGTSQPGSIWRTFDQVMAGNSDSYTQASGFGKPVILAEFASAEVGGDKAAWIEDAFARIGTQYDFVGFLWFNINKKADWRVDSSPAALAAFQNSMSYECYLDGLDQGGPNPGCPPGNNPPPPTGTTTILEIVEGWDEKNQKTLSEDEKLYIVQTSDNQWWDTEANYSNYFEFQKTIPANASIQSVKIYLEHWEEEGIGDGMVEWQIGEGSLTSPTILASQDSPKRTPESNEGVDAWDVTSLMTTAALLNDLKVVIKNADSQGKKTKLDHLRVEVVYE